MHPDGYVLERARKLRVAVEDFERAFSQPTRGTETWDLAERVASQANHLRKALRAAGVRPDLARLAMPESREEDLGRRVQKTRDLGEHWVHVLESVQARRRERVADRARCPLTTSYHFVASERANGARGRRDPCVQAMPEERLELPTRGL